MKRTHIILLTVIAAVLATATSALYVISRNADAPQQIPAQTSASPETQPSPVPKAPRSFTLVTSGDILIHDTVAQRARANASSSAAQYDFRPMFADVKPILSAADLALCHLETPLSPTNTQLSYYPIFNVPHELADAIADAGFGACSTASNHSLDKRFAGLKATLDILDNKGIVHSGMARSAEEKATPTLIELPQAVVASLSYTFSFNGIPLPSAQPFAANRIDAATILDEAKRARAAGAEFVVVSLHWGTEYSPTINGQQRTLGNQLLSSPDIDLIVGHHAHVVQPIGKVGEKFVVYGMGNFISAQNSRCCPTGTEDGVMVHFTVREVEGRFKVAEVSFTPTLVESRTYRIVPLSRVPSGSSPSIFRAMQTSWCRTLSRFGGSALGIKPIPPVSNIPC
jgi:poly-gamma-glutamate synthesis protein (capsule biosynthesis protein)